MSLDEVRAIDEASRKSTEAEQNKIEATWQWIKDASTPEITKPEAEAEPEPEDPHSWESLQEQLGYPMEQPVILVEKTPEPAAVEHIPIDKIDLTNPDLEAIANELPPEKPVEKVEDVEAENENDY